MAEKRSQTKAETPKPAEFPGTDAALHHTLMDYQATSMRWATWAAAAWAERMGTIGVEAMDFAARRLREDARAAHAMAGCRDAGEVREVQARFLQDAIEQYTQECARLMGMGAGLVEEIQRRGREGGPRPGEREERHPHDIVGEDGTPENVAV